MFGESGFIRDRHFGQPSLNRGQRLLAPGVQQELE